MFDEDNRADDWRADLTNSAEHASTQKETTVNEPIDDEKTEPQIDAAAQEPEVKPWGSFRWGEEVRTAPPPTEDHH